MRDQLAAWQMLGMQIPVEFDALHKSAFSRFAQASAIQESVERAGRLALESLRDSHAAADAYRYKPSNRPLAPIARGATPSPS